MIGDKIGMTIPVSSEMLRFMEPPTDEERESAAEWSARQQQHRSNLRAQLNNRADPLVRAILDLHSPTDDSSWPDCNGDDFSGWEADRPLWPCRTVRLIAEQLHVDVPEELA